MSRVFVVGAGPMMDGAACRVTAHAMRTWHFVTALRRAGLDVALYTVSQNLSESDPRERLAEPREKSGFAYENLDMRMGNMLAHLAEKCAAFRPECVVGVSTEPSAWACRMRPAVPVWADLHGWVMAEAQLKAARDGCDDVLEHFWCQERPVLRRADRISVVSRAQQFAVYGELASVGRLNRFNAEVELVVKIPSSVDPQTPLAAGDPSRVANLVGGADKFVALWSGGFNLWTDPVTLFEALEWAMARDSSVHFVATAGGIPGHADTVFESFRRRVEQSPHRPRYHLLDWVPAGDFADYLAGAHLAVCVDFPCVETGIGVRTRLLEAMIHGLPVLLTRGTELSFELEAAGVAWIVEPRHPAALGEKIVAAARERAQTAEMARRAKRFVLEHYSFERTLAPLVAWAAAPGFAPDNAVKRGQSPTIFEAAVNRLEANAAALDEVDDVGALLDARRDLERLRSRWPLRLWRRLRGRR